MSQLISIRFTKRFNTKHSYAHYNHSEVNDTSLSLSSSLSLSASGSVPVVPGVEATLRPMTVAWQGSIPHVHRVTHTHAHCHPDQGIDGGSRDKEISSCFISLVSDQHL